MLHLGLAPKPHSHRKASAPLRPPPIQTSLNGPISRDGFPGYNKYGSQSPLSLAREARQKASQQMTTTTAPSPTPARADPCSVPCSPTLSLCAASLSAPALPLHEDVALIGKGSLDGLMPSCTLDGVRLQLSAGSPTTPALSSCTSSPTSPDSSIARTYPWAVDEPREKAQGWLTWQHNFNKETSSTEDSKTSTSSTLSKVRVRGRAFSESASGLSSRLSQWRGTPLARLGVRNRIGKRTDVLYPIIDCAQENEQESAQKEGTTRSWDIVASSITSADKARGSHSLRADVRRECEPIKEDETPAAGSTGHEV